MISVSGVHLGASAPMVDKKQISNFELSSLPILIQTVVYIQTNFGHAGKKSTCQIIWREDMAYAFKPNILFSIHRWQVPRLPNESVPKSSMVLFANSNYECNVIADGIISFHLTKGIYKTWKIFVSKYMQILVSYTSGLTLLWQRR